jgi:hypothetical protein
MTPQKFFLVLDIFIWQNNGRKQEMKYVFYIKLKSFNG